MIPISKDRIGQDLWPNKRKYLVRKALTAKDGIYIYISIGEAETLARKETEREINQRLRQIPLMEVNHANRLFR